MIRSLRLFGIALSAGWRVILAFFLARLRLMIRSLRLFGIHLSGTGTERVVAPLRQSEMPPVNLEASASRDSTSTGQLRGFRLEGFDVRNFSRKGRGSSLRQSEMPPVNLEASASRDSTSGISAARAGKRSWMPRSKWRQSMLLRRVESSKVASPVSESKRGS
ncbi:hypothetical protein QE152_g26037 [Popillia japonica]|uniref:Secreted protein n=1 Tax=Popillia japonica TaxID=7064 RepID=A0AAW1JZ75_POPJA